MQKFCDDNNISPFAVQWERLTERLNFITQGFRHESLPGNLSFTHITSTKLNRNYNSNNNNEAEEGNTVLVSYNL